MRIIKRSLVAAMAGLVGTPLAEPRPVRAQDVPGIEICTRESRLDRRTGCLQSNVEFLQQVIAKNAREAQQKLTAAERDIAALQAQAAAANRDIKTPPIYRSKEIRSATQRRYR